MKKIIVLLIFTFGSFHTYCQIGKEFWFAAPDINDKHGDEPLSLNISTFNEPATVTVSIPANPSFTPIVLDINPNSFGTVVLECHSDNRANPPHYNCSNNPDNLKTLIENNVINTVENKGLFISSTSDISVYYEVLGSNCNLQRCKVSSADIFALKGKNALGLEFYVSWQNGHALVNTDFWNDNLGNKNSNSLCIVATEDNTTISINPSVNLIGGSTAGNNFTINLSKGQTYAIKSSGTSALDHLSGTYIAADKPIAVSVVDDSPADRKDFAAHSGKPKVYDLVGDQLIPVTHAGMEFIVSGFYAYVTCTQNATQINVITSTGNTSVTKNAGETFEVDLTTVTGPVYITANKPVMLFHLRGIEGLDGYPEFGGAVVPQIKCTGSQTVRFSRSTNEYQEQFFLTILTRSAAVGDFILNGNSSLIKPSDFTPVPGTTEWMYMEKGFDTDQIPPFQTSTVSNSSSVFHLGIIFGRPFIDRQGELDSVSTGCRYGYFSNFGQVDVNIDVENQCIQEGESLMVIPGTFDQYYWYRNDNFLHGNNILETSQDGEYSIKVVDITGCSDSASFTLDLEVIPKFQLPNDTILCKGQETILKIENGSYGTNGTFNWSFIPSGSIIPTSLSSDTSVTAVEPGIYILTINSPTCGSYSDSVNVGNWNIFVPNLFTPNNDGLNDQFFIPGTEHGKWLLTIYNRWGDRVFYDEDYDNKWDATDASKKVNEGVYFYYLEEEKTKECNVFKGWVQVVK